MIDKRKFYINGIWTKQIEKNDFEVINPSNEEPYAVISLGTKQDVDNAVEAAKRAFFTWSQTKKKEKIILLENLLEIYKSKWDEITQTMSEEMGAPLDWSSSAQTSSGADHINDFILRLKNFEFETEFKKNSNNYQLIGKQIDGEKIIEKLLKSNNKTRISNFFDNLNTSVILNLEKVYLEKDE